MRAVTARPVIRTRPRITLNLTSNLIAHTLPAFVAVWDRIRLPERRRDPGRTRSVRPVWTLKVVSYSDPTWSAMTYLPDQRLPVSVMIVGGKFVQQPGFRIFSATTALIWSYNMGLGVGAVP